MLQDKSLGPGQKSLKYLDKARAVLKEGKKEAALRFAIEGLKHGSNDEVSSALNRVIAAVLSDWGELVRALPYAEKSLKLARETGNQLLIYRGLRIMGKIQARMNRYGDAMKTWQESLEYCRGDRKVQGRLHLNMAILEQRLDRHDSAFKLLEKAKELADQVQDYQTIAHYFSRMVYSHIELGNYDEALSNLAELEKQAQESGSRQLLGMARFRKGSIHLSRDEFSQAIEPLQDAACIFAELGEKKNQAQILCDLARSYIGVGKLARVDSILLEAISVAEGIGSDPVMNAVYLVLAELSACRGNIERVVYYYQEALRLAEKVGSEDRFRIFHESLAEMLKKLGFAMPGLRPLLDRARENYIRLGLEGELSELSPWLERIP